MQPEKMIIFGPMIIFFVFFALMILGFLAIVFKLINKGRKSAWKGELIDKLYNEKEDMDDSSKTNHFYTLVFQTDEGKQVKVGVSQKMYNDYKIGDKAEKKSGEFWQKKLD
jgi:hypothetical protein